MASGESPNCERTMNSIIRIAGTTLSIVVASCAAADQALEGRVLNHESGAPVSGAFVIAEWTHAGSDPVGSRTTCLHVEIVRSDEAGRYHVPLGRWGAEPAVSIYKSGFKEYFTKKRLTDAEAAARRRLLELIPLGTDSVAKRKDDFEYYGTLRSCGSSDIGATLTPLYQALDEEAAVLKIPSYFMRTLKERERRKQEEAAEEGRARR